MIIMIIIWPCWVVPGESLGTLWGWAPGAESEPLLRDSAAAGWSPCAGPEICLHPANAPWCRPLVPASYQSRQSGGRIRFLSGNVSKLKGMWLVHCKCSGMISVTFSILLMYKTIQITYTLMLCIVFQYRCQYDTGELPIMLPCSIKFSRQNFLQSTK